MNSGRFKKAGIACSVIGALLIGGGALYQYRLSESGYTGNVMTDRYEYSSVRELVAISTSIPIRVEYGDTENVIIDYKGRLPLIFSQDNGLLRVTQNDTFMMRMWSPGYDGAEIHITLPHKNYESITLTSSSGSIDMDSINAAECDISTRNGDITLINIDERTSIRTESGNIRASYSSLGGDAEINAGSGNVKLYLPDELSMRLEFLTDGGALISDYFNEKYDGFRHGDVFALHGKAEHLLKVTTTGGNLIVY